MLTASQTKKLSLEEIDEVFGDPVAVHMVDAAAAVKGDADFLDEKAEVEGGKVENETVEGVR